MPSALVAIEMYNLNGQSYDHISSGISHRHGRWKSMPLLIIPFLQQLLIQRLFDIIQTRIFHDVLHLHVERLRLDAGRKELRHTVDASVFLASDGKASLPEDPEVLTPGLS